MRLVFVLPVVSQPRYRKRIEGLRDSTVTTVLAFERSYFEGSPMEYESLGTLRHGRYFSRLWALLKATTRVRAAIADADVVYAFGLDMLWLVWMSSRMLSRRPRMVYEVGDIRPILIRRAIMSKFVRWMERYLLRRTYLLVVTSEAYITGYYEEIQGLTNLRYHVIENKLHPEQLAGIEQRVGDRELKQSVLRIGYFGLLRCERSWEILRRVAIRARGRVVVYVRGLPMGIDDLETVAKETPGVEYGGPFVSPDDLPHMYGKVDIVWAAYPYQGTSIGNWQWARTNRFYESCYFGKPMLAQSGTEDGRVIEEKNLGMCLDLSNIDDAVARILQITNNQVVEWGSNVRQLPESDYLYQREHLTLLQQMMADDIGR